MTRTRELTLDQPTSDGKGRSTVFRASYKADCRLGDFETLIIEEPVGASPGNDVFWAVRIVSTGTEMELNWWLIGSIKVDGRWQHYYLRND